MLNYIGRVVTVSQAMCSFRKILCNILCNILCFLDYDGRTQNGNGQHSLSSEGLSGMLDFIYYITMKFEYTASKGTHTCTHY